ncbi:MAG: hypothetical protein MHM6MM_002957 [Cercozoa sp. M6MM]
MDLNDSLHGHAIPPPSVMTQAAEWSALDRLSQTKQQRDDALDALAVVREELSAVLCDTEVFGDTALDQLDAMAERDEIDDSGGTMLRSIRPLIDKIRYCLVTRASSPTAGGKQSRNVAAASTGGSDTSEEIVKEWTLQQLQQQLLQLKQLSSRNQQLLERVAHALADSGLTEVSVISPENLVEVLSQIIRLAQHNATSAGGTQEYTENEGETATLKFQVEHLKTELERRDNLVERVRRSAHKALNSVQQQWKQRHDVLLQQIEELRQQHAQTVSTSVNLRGSERVSDNNNNNNNNNQATVQSNYASNVEQGHSESDAKSDESEIEKTAVDASLHASCQTETAALVSVGTTVCVSVHTVQTGTPNTHLGVSDACTETQVATCDSGTSPHVLHLAHVACQVTRDARDTSTQAEIRVLGVSSLTQTPLTHFADADCQTVAELYPLEYENNSSAITESAVDTTNAITASDTTQAPSSSTCDTTASIDESCTIRQRKRVQSAPTVATFVSHLPLTPSPRRTTVAVAQDALRISEHVNHRVRQDISQVIDQLTSFNEEVSFLEQQRAWSCIREIAAAHAPVHVKQVSVQVDSDSPRSKSKRVLNQVNSSTNTRHVSLRDSAINTTRAGVQDGTTNTVQLLQHCVAVNTHNENLELEDTDVSLDLHIDTSQSRDVSDSFADDLSAFVSDMKLYWMQCRTKRKQHFLYRQQQRLSALQQHILQVRREHNAEVTELRQALQRLVEQQEHVQTIRQSAQQQLDAATRFVHHSVVEKTDELQQRLDKLSHALLYERQERHSLRQSLQQRVLHTDRLVSKKELELQKTEKERKRWQQETLQLRGRVRVLSLHLARHEMLLRCADDTVASLKAQVQRGHFTETRSRCKPPLLSPVVLKTERDMFRSGLRPLRRLGQLRFEFVSAISAPTFPLDEITSRVHKALLQYTKNEFNGLSAEDTEYCLPFFVGEKNHEELSLDLYCELLLVLLLSKDFKHAHEVIDRFVEVSQDRPDEFVDGLFLKCVYEKMSELRQDTSVLLRFFDRYRPKVEMDNILEELENYDSLARAAFPKELMKVDHMIGPKESFEWLLDNLNTLAARMCDEDEDPLLVAIRWLPGLECLANTAYRMELTEERTQAIQNTADKLQKAIEIRDDFMPQDNLPWFETLRRLRRFLFRLRHTISLDRQHVQRVAKKAQKAMEKEEESDSSKKEKKQKQKTPNQNMQYRHISRKRELQRLKTRQPLKTVSKLWNYIEAGKTVSLKAFVEYINQLVPERERISWVDALSRDQEEESTEEESPEEEESLKEEESTEEEDSLELERKAAFEKILAKFQERQEKIEYGNYKLTSQMERAETAVRETKMQRRDIHRIADALAFGIFATGNGADNSAEKMISCSQRFARNEINAMRKMFPNKEDCVRMAFRAYLFELLYFENCNYRKIGPRLSHVCYIAALLHEIRALAATHDTSNSVDCERIRDTHQAFYTMFVYNRYHKDWYDEFISFDSETPNPWDLLYELVEGFPLAVSVGKLKGLTGTEKQREVLRALPRLLHPSDEDSYFGELTRNETIVLLDTVRECIEEYPALADAGECECSLEKAMKLLRAEESVARNCSYYRKPLRFSLDFVKESQQHELTDGRRVMLQAHALRIQDHCDQERVVELIKDDVETTMEYLRRTLQMDSFDSEIYRCKPE